MRISDWSSDVCSSDLKWRRTEGLGIEAGDVGDLRFDRKLFLTYRLPEGRAPPPAARPAIEDVAIDLGDLGKRGRPIRHDIIGVIMGRHSHTGLDATRQGRSEERRVGKACVSTCRYRWSPYH